MAVDSDTAVCWIKKAEKSLKTSVFKRSPDYDGAIENYTNAALCYRKMKELGKAAELYKNIAQLHLKTNSYFQAAKSFETASILFKELNQFDISAELFLQAGEYFQRCGSMDSATLLFSRAAKSLESQLPVRAAEFYEKAADTCNMDEKFSEAMDHCNNGARILVRSERLSDASRLLRQYIAYCVKSNAFSSDSADTASFYHLIARAAFVLVLMKLSVADEVAAQKVYTEAVEQWNFSETEEGVLANALIHAFEERDVETVKRLLQKPCVRNLDLAYAKLGKKVMQLTEAHGEPYLSQKPHRSEDGTITLTEDDIC